MGDILVDEVKARLAEEELEPECPRCGSRVLFGEWTRTFRLDLDKKDSKETLDSGVEVSNIFCSCGWSLNSH